MTSANEVRHSASEIRRIKCDECKPFCKRCTATGRRCDGYAPPQQSLCAKDSLSIQPSLSLSGSTTTLEKRSFEYFRLRTAPCISGSFKDPVWEKVVLQAFQDHQAVRFALSALSSLHEETTIRQAAKSDGVDSGRMQTTFPTQQYSKALNGLRILLGQPTPPLNVVLLCSLLCVHFEALSERFAPALVHIEHAILILDRNSKPEPLDEDIIRALMRVDLQGSQYIDTRIPGMSAYAAALDNELPTAFTSLAHARNYCSTWLSRLFHFMRGTSDAYKFRDPGDVPIEAYAAAQQLQQRFIDIDRLILEFTQRPALRLTIREQNGLSMLRARAKVDGILSAAALYSESTVFDRYLEVFEEIYVICKYVLDSEPTDRRLFAASLDDGLLYPLYFTVVCCRDSRLRHAALAAMKKLPSRDGIWHVEALSGLAESVVAYEEEGINIKTPLCSDIPEWRRVLGTAFDALGNVAPHNRTTCINGHFRTRPNGMDGEWVETKRTIEW
ncbi:hypothetical protein B0A48_02875 [Cryoendolithus antarcticus]|uniref:Zn(2)-C6 fungal-type domain-containing protein n=1 Tax=Cryoendolithus antarcticus TaxID=1507870 RepID=A0A1V8TLQ4_9PEZI|nr:hypothetical protein B0A48_02875 [Cryoendolithus antarcticus]